jgi:TPR repeat protein
MGNLGGMYAAGYGVTTNYDEAVKWFRKAADAGNARGIRGLAFMYENGYGVQKDVQQAVSLYRKAANLGDQHAKDALKRLGETP